MRKEFNELVETMKRWDLFQKDDEVDFALTNLSNKIDEIEKRIECAVRSAREINQFVSKYTEDVDNHQPINMSVNDHDFILNRSSDVDIALDMGDNMCVSDNWYNLFSPKEEETYPIVNCLDCGHPQPLLEENIHVDSVSRYMVCEQCENQFNIDDEPKPIAVGNIEYDFPEEVYTIANADNSEIIGDVYESDFIRLCELGLIWCESDMAFPISSSPKANYVVRSNEFIVIVKNKQIDLSKVPIIKKEVFMTFISSCGEIDCDVEGNVIEVRHNGDEDNYLNDIAVFDLAEYYTFLNSKNITMGEADDILAIGFWKKDNTYHEADMYWREEIFGEEPPTMLCADSDKHKIVNNIISQLKAIEVDGETMEYILKQVGMDEQMFRQLFERQG